MYIVTVLNKPYVIVETFEKALEVVSKDLYIEPVNKKYHLKNLENFGETWFTYGFNTATIGLFRNK